MDEYFIPANQINWRLDSIVFLLNHYDELSDGKYPLDGSASVGSNSNWRKAPYENVALIKAELDLRLGQTPYICEGFYRNRENQKVTCDHRQRRCDYLACWQLNRRDGKYLIWLFREYREKNQEFMCLEDVPKDDRHLIYFIASGNKHRSITMAMWRHNKKKRKES